MSGPTPRGVIRLGALESTTASRLPPLLARLHKTYPGVRLELTTGTNDALTAAVIDRHLDAAFVAEVPTGHELAHMPVFTERLIVISALDHRRIRSPADLEGASVIAFPDGCAYRRRPNRWLGDARPAGLRFLDLCSYHAIFACVASGTGIALAHARVVTPLIWRAGEESSALMALKAALKRGVDDRSAVLSRTRIAQ